MGGLCREGHINLIYSLSHCRIRDFSRRRRAKRTRETRKSTQPVPADILKQISIRDAEELAKMDAKEKEESPTEVITLLVRRGNPPLR